MSALQDRNSNAQPTSNPTESEKQMAGGVENKPEEAGVHKQVLDHKDAKQGGTVSPSDAILSPASEKLAGFKQRQINKQQTGKNSTSRLLFGRTPSGSSGGLDDILAGDKKPT
ncbi:hypothetical protein LTR36_008471 [Oleoguttula mirabilis]|uniref:Uncharacterized protein n=1 Tax=Oleoguttula mirabilis TaxID=1507867 RepID=A0AAV9J7U0_9PEZI|nr:hypothetical protein LTR36_008471 [Oleoguttula mirabilis]